MNKVIKRDGTVVDFDKSKIVNAIGKAFAEFPEKKLSCNGAQAAEEIADIIERNLSEDEEIHVEVIQDSVENILMDFDTDVAKAYIRYRYLHNVARDQYDELMNVVSDKLGGNNVQNQNANVDEHSFGGRVGEASNAVMKQYALKYCVSDRTRKNHENNEVYIHDLDRYAVGCHNCLTIPFDKLLAEGFNTRQVDIRPANSVAAALQLVAVIFQLQSLQQFG